MKITKNYLKQVIKEELDGDSSAGKEILEVQLVLLKMRQEPKYKPSAEEITKLLEILSRVRYMVRSKGA